MQQSVRSVGKQITGQHQQLKKGPSNTVQYIDPLGYLPSKEIADKFKSFSDINSLTSIFTQENRPQVAGLVPYETANKKYAYWEGNDYDCGPFLVEAVGRLVEGQSVDVIQQSMKKDTQEDSKKYGQELREKHKKILSELRTKEEETSGNDFDNDEDDNDNRKEDSNNSSNGSNEDENKKLNQSKESSTTISQQNQNEMISQSKNQQNVEQDNKENKKDDDSLKEKKSDSNKDSNGDNDGSNLLNQVIPNKDKKSTNDENTINQTPKLGGIRLIGRSKIPFSSCNFYSLRELAAYLGSVPKQHSSSGKARLLGISKRGDRYVRCLLVHDRNHERNHKKKYKGNKVI